VTATDRSTDSPSDFQGRVVVLIDGGSASASEVVAGALQDLKRATLVGSRSYGKGSVQETRTFEDGSAFKLTVARYHLPSGRAIADHEGLVPDVGVPRPRVESPAVVALRAELAGIATTDEQRARVEAQLTALSAEAAEVDPPRGGAFAERLAADPQLAAAWDRLRAGP
jgi:C-terminal processing protease CtpA/Prc